MRAVSLPRKISSALLKRVGAYHINMAIGHKLSLKSTTAYMVDALSEGLKQTFLGYDINTEFLTLTIRAYAANKFSGYRNSVTKILKYNLSITSLKYIS